MTDLQVLYHDLVRFETELWAALDARLRSDCNLPLTWKLLRHRDGQRVHDVAEEFVITVGGASKIIDRIELAGLCRRVPNPRDRRSVLIVLTPEGTGKVDAATAVFDDELARRFGAVLGPVELDRMAAGLRLLRSAPQENSAGRA